MRLKIELTNAEILLVLRALTVYVEGSENKTDRELTKQVKLKINKQVADHYAQQ